jgi:hypothetical protein
LDIISNCSMHCYESLKILSHVIFTIIRVETQNILTTLVLLTTRTILNGFNTSDIQELCLSAEPQNIPYPVRKYTSLRSMSHPWKCERRHFVVRLSKDCIWQIRSSFTSKGIANCKQKRQTSLSIDMHFLHTRIYILFTVSAISKTRVYKWRTQLLKNYLWCSRQQNTDITKRSINLSPVSSLHTAQRRVPCLGSSVIHILPFEHSLINSTELSSHGFIQRWTQYIT